jgi:hypothetical protein
MAARHLALHTRVRLRRPAALVIGAALVVASALPALAGAATVTLGARRDPLVAGDAVKLSGRISPRRRGELVSIVDGRGRVRARVATGARGRFRTWLRPRRDVTLRARWADASSEPLHLRMRPRVRVRLRRVRIFGRAMVSVRVRPRQPHSRIRLRLRRNGEVIARRRARLRGGGRFTARMRIRRPGSYRARATLRHRGRYRGRDWSRPRRTRLPRLTRGAHSPHVQLLEKRLRRLRYHIRGVDWRYDYRTADALRAFNKVQRRPRVAAVTTATWRALATPRRPRPRWVRPRRHIEIDQTKQVLYVVRGARVRSIVHTSTGANGVTRDGAWTVWRKIAGYSPGRLYYPSYFDGLRAIHGWPHVPVSPASHGCARVPMWAAKWIYRRTQIGTRVVVYH